MGARSPSRGIAPARSRCTARRSKASASSSSPTRRNDPSGHAGRPMHGCSRSCVTPAGTSASTSGSWIAMASTSATLRTSRTSCTAISRGHPTAPSSRTPRTPPAWRKPSPCTSSMSRRASSARSATARATTPSRAGRPMARCSCFGRPATPHERTPISSSFPLRAGRRGASRPAVASTASPSMVAGRRTARGFRSRPTRGGARRSRPRHIRGASWDGSSG